MVVRLLFTYDGETTRLVSRRLVNMRPRVAPMTHDRSGTYVDLRAADDRTLVRVPAHVATTQEVFPEPPSTRIVRVDAPSVQTFLVTAPVVPDIDYIALVRPHAAGRTHGRTQDLARFPWVAPSWV